MRSSTFNFDHGVPDGPWWRGMIGGLVLAVVSAAGLEAFWRGRGHMPSVVDDKQLWSLERLKVDNWPRSTVVFLGNSHSQVGIATAVARDALTGRQVRQLSTSGSNPAATLKDLAFNSTFAGVAIVNLTATCLEPGLQKTIYVDQRPFVEHYHNVAQWEGLLNRQLAVEVQSRATFIEPTLSLRSMAYGRQLPKPVYIRTLADRSRMADYSVFDQETIRKSRIVYMEDQFARSTKAAQAEWFAIAAELESSVAAIQRRRGKVAFVHFPLTGKIWEMESDRYPRKEYWDRLAKSSAATCIHFEDHEPLRKFSCPDGQHLDRRDAPAFTTALLALLEERGVFENL